MFDPGRIGKLSVTANTALSFIWLLVSLVILYIACLPTGCITVPEVVTGDLGPDANAGGGNGLGNILSGWTFGDGLGASILLVGVFFLLYYFTARPLRFLTGWMWTQVVKKLTNGNGGLKTHASV